MKRCCKSFLATSGAAFLASTVAAFGADVTYERLRNPEPQNWLTNHHDYGSQRYSPLDLINRSNARNLKLAFTVPIGGKTGNEYIEATPLVDNGFMYLTDVWGIVYKLDVRSGTHAPVVWKMDPHQQKPDRNRGVALWGNLVISVTGYDGRIIATDAETGQVVWDKKHSDNPDLEFSAAPLALGDAILVGASGGDNGVRDWLAALDPKTGEQRWKTFIVPAPGEPGSETWKDKANAWQTGGGALYVTGSYDPQTNLTYWGTGNPVPRYDSSYRPGDNLFTDSSVAFDAASGKMQWYFQHTPNDNKDYDSTGPQIIIDGRVNGEDRKLLIHANRNGFEYMLDRLNGQFLKSVQYSQKVTWTKGLDPKTGKPVDYDPRKDVQNFAIDWPGGADVVKNACPDVHGGTNFWPPSYSQRTRLFYIAGNEGCADIIPDLTAHVRGKFTGGNYRNEARITSDLVVVDPVSGEVKARKEEPYPNHSGVLTTAGGIVVTALLDGTVAAYDDQTLDELWKFNTGTGFVVPPMTYAVNGMQYIAIASGLNGVARAKLAHSPEMKNQSNATMLFVFAVP
ncbi:MAG TPA: PQQ-binding-like beta-propeller repeat protein [Xanthobacteraceae bacterium]|jgi:alcohol dehydrogenase (cytochrome c)